VTTDSAIVRGSSTTPETCPASLIRWPTRAIVRMIKAHDPNSTPTRTETSVRVSSHASKTTGTDESAGLKRIILATPTGHRSTTSIRADKSGCTISGEAEIRTRHVPFEHDLPQLAAPATPQRFTNECSANQEAVSVIAVLPSQIVERRHRSPKRTGMARSGRLAVSHRTVALDVRLTVGWIQPRFTA